MTQTASSKPNGPSLGAIISAIVVVGVFLVLGFVLANAGQKPVTQTAAQPTAAALDAAAPTANAATGSAAQAVSADVAARNDKYKAAPSMTIDPKKNYTATITTPRGDVEIKLRPDLAPVTVNNFVFLAKDGFYNGVTWHRVLEGFMAQTGDPTGIGSGGPGYTIKDEFTNKVAFDKPGVVAMANTGQPNSGGSQFFITKAAYPSLNGGYTIFGEVTKGQDIVDAIPLRDPQQNPKTLGEQILKVTVSEG